MTGDGLQIEHRVQGAISALAKDHTTHKHGPRCTKLLHHILMPGEETILECKQSRLHSITPARVIATTRRMIIVKPSFWGFYMGYDVISPTEYHIIPYKHLISVIMSKGRMLSTIHMRIHGFTDSTSSTKDEGELYGIRTNEALRLTNFLEEIVEYQEEAWERKLEQEQKRKLGSQEVTYDLNALSLEEAKEMVQRRGSKFVWLGLEPLDYVTTILGVGTESVFRSTTSIIAEAQAQELEKYRGCIFVCYSGSMGSRFSAYLKNNYDIEAYVLKGGILDVARAHFNQRA